MNPVDRRHLQFHQQRSLRNQLGPPEEVCMHKLCAGAYRGIPDAAGGKGFQKPVSTGLGSRGGGVTSGGSHQQQRHNKLLLH